MPPRYAYWTIIAGGLPTAFRMTEREELLPTFRRIKQRHPDAEMKYFARGRLWGSPVEARVESERLQAEANARRGMRAPSRGRAWRPGGEHQDPRQKFKDAKKVRNQDRRQERFDRKHKTGAPPSGGGAPTRRTPASTRAPRTEWRDRPGSDRPPRDRARQEGAPGDRPREDDRGDRGFRGKPPAARDRPWNDRGPRTSRPPASGGRPWSDRPPRDRPRQGGAPVDRPREDDRGDRGFRGKPPAARDRPWNDRGPRTSRPPASGGRPWSDRPPRDRARQGGAPVDRPREDDRGDRGFRGKPAGGDDRRAGSKPGGPYGSAKGSRARKSGPVKDRRRR
jgi:hypothetical protein